MKSQFKKTGDAIVLKLEGKLDFGTADVLRAELEKQILKPAKLLHSSDRLSSSRPTEILVDMRNLEFVGSSGISNFVQLLKDFNLQCPIRPKFCNVRSEFQKIMKSYDSENRFEFVTESPHPGSLRSRRISKMDH